MKLTKTELKEMIREALREELSSKKELKESTAKRFNVVRELRDIDEHITAGWECVDYDYNNNTVELSFNSINHPLTVWVTIAVTEDGHGYTMKHYVSSDSGRNESDEIVVTDTYTPTDNMLDPVTALIDDIDNMVRNMDYTDSLDDLFMANGYNFTEADILGVSASEVDDLARDVYIDAEFEDAYKADGYAVGEAVEALIVEVVASEYPDIDLGSVPDRVSSALSNMLETGLLG